MKKVLSLVLAVMMVVGLGAVAFAAQTDRHDGVTAADIKLGFSNQIITNHTFSANPDNKSISFLLMDAKNGNAPFTKEEIRDKKIGIQIRASEGSSVIKGASIDYAAVDGEKDKVAFVKLEFVGHLVSVDSRDYEVKLYPTVNKVRARENEVTVSGSYGNFDQHVGSGDDYVFISDNPVVIADDYIKNIEVDFGQGVSMFTRMFEGRKYYGRVTQDIAAGDEEIFNKYPDIDTVYNLETINLSATGDIVKFNVGDNMYVYVLDEDGNLVFLGRTNDRLPYYTKYFLAGKELDIEEVIEDVTEAPAEEEPEAVGPTGGDDVPENVNDNPGTGR